MNYSTQRIVVIWLEGSQQSVMKCDVKSDKINEITSRIPMDMQPSNYLKQQSLNKEETRYTYLGTTAKAYRNAFDEFLHVGYLLFNKIIHKEHVIFFGTKSENESDQYKTDTSSVTSTL